MAVLTANDFATQMVAQARLLDPSFSGEIGTPERKLIDAVAQTLADNQVDMTGLQSALNIDSKYGSNLDQFTALFGMQRQQAQAATGYVTFSTGANPAVSTITIPAGVVLQSSSTSVQYTTTGSGTVSVGQTTSSAVPVQAVIAGSAGNTGAATITQMVGQLVPGIVSVTNGAALTNGTDAEDDNSFKTRFKNTWARNLAGTEDQYLALALASGYTTKAVVVGTQSKYQEYVQVPSYDDAGYLDGTQTTKEDTYGVQNQWTSALSSVPYAKQIYTSVPTFVSDENNIFYQPDVDFVFNYPPVLKGDVLRDQPHTFLTANVTFPSSTITVSSTNGIPEEGTLQVGSDLVTYSGTTSTTFTNVTSGSTNTWTTNTPVWYVPTAGVTPNFTFINVYDSATPIAGLQALTPDEIVLTEYRYVSQASRNDIDHGVDNAVDVYVNGENDTPTSCITLPNVLNTQFNTNPNSPWYYENFRRDGNPVKRPHLNNYITPLLQQPVDSLPSSIVLNNQPFVLGTDYWLVHEYDSVGGSIRARDGIEWNFNSSPTNNIVTASQAGNIPLSVSYSFDANIPVLQSSMAAAKQIATDVLVHKARTRYLKLDITVVYSANANPSVVNSAISSTVQTYLSNQYFGSVIRLSNLLEIIHEVPGVDNVRWSNDTAVVDNALRVIETDVNGYPVHGVSVDEWVKGGTGTEQQTIYIVGEPFGIFNGVADSFVLTWPGSDMTGPTASIPLISSSTGLPVTAAQIQAAIQAVQPASGVYHGITVAQDSRPTTGVLDPIVSFTMTYGAAGAADVPTVTQTVTQSTYGYDEDFFLLDDELVSLPAGQVTATDNMGLPADTLPGLIIRQRAQNTFFRS